MINKMESFTTLFLRGLAYKYFKTGGAIYVRAFLLSGIISLSEVYMEVYRYDKYDWKPFIYERAVKLGRRGRSPHNQVWSVDLIYS